MENNVIFRCNKCGSAIIKNTEIKETISKKRYMVFECVNCNEYNTHINL